MWWMMVIPIITVILLYKLQENEMDWWEYLLPVVTTTLSLLILTSACDYFMASDEEFHGGWVVRAEWDEHWTETYTETESYTDSKGNTQTRLVVKTRYHPDEYHIYDSNDYAVSIDYNHFNELSTKYGNQKTSHPWNSGQSSWGDGRKFTTISTKFTPCFTSHTYRNRVARSQSVFNFKKVSKEDKQKYGVYEYPEIYNYYCQDSIVGWNDDNAQTRLTEFNAKMGAVKQVRMFVLVFHNQPLQAAITQQLHWKNGNKNEVVVCIGETKGVIDWVFSFAWDNERLLVDIREEVAAQSGNLDMTKIVSIITPLVEKNFKRKEFKDFEYIKLEPPAWAKFLCFTVILTINIGIAFYVTNNQYRA